MGNFSWTNFKPFVIIYLALCVLGYFLSPGIQNNINYKVNRKHQDVRRWSKEDLTMIYDMYTDPELIALMKQIQLDSARDNGMMVVSEL
jgi:hypothetical protein